MERDQLIAEVARTTGVRLDRSDPILAAAVVHEALLNEALVKLDRQVTVQADRVTAASTQAVVDARQAAEALITDAGEWIEQQVKAAADLAAKRISGEVAEQVKLLRLSERRRNVLLIVLSSAALILLSAICGYALAAR